MLCTLENHLKNKREFKTLITAIQTKIYEYDIDDKMFKQIKIMFINTLTNYKNFCVSLTKYFKITKNTEEIEEPHEKIYYQLLVRYLKYLSKEEKEDLFKLVVDLIKSIKKSKLSKESLKEEIREHRKNVLQIIDIDKLIKIYEHIGSEETIIVSDISAFIHIKENNQTIFEDHPLLEGMNSTLKTKMIRFIANKLKIAVKMDFFFTETLVNFKEQLQKKRNSLLDKNTKKIIERPIFKKKVKRGKKNANKK